MPGGEGCLPTVVRAWRQVAHASTPRTAHRTMPVWSAAATRRRVHSAPDQQKRHVAEHNRHGTARRWGPLGKTKALGGRVQLKGVMTLAELLVLLEPFEDKRAPPGVRPFRGVEACMALNHLHRLRADPHKDATQQAAAERQMTSFARMTVEDMEFMSPKNLAWALNAVKGLPGFESLFEAAAARLCQVPSPQWSIQSAALISNAYAHGSDGLGMKKDKESFICVPEAIVPHLSRVVQQLLLAAALDQLQLRDPELRQRLSLCPPKHGPDRVERTEGPQFLRNLSIIANAFAKLHPDDDALFDSVGQAARRAAVLYCQDGAPFFLELQDVARTLNAFAHTKRLDAARVESSRGLFQDFFTVLRVSLSHLRSRSRPRGLSAGAEGACGPGCSFVSGGVGLDRAVHGCVPANLGIIANAMARVGLYHLPTLLAVFDAVERLAETHPQHFDVQAVVNMADAIAKLEERAREHGGGEGKEAAERIRMVAPRIFRALSKVLHRLVCESNVPGSPGDHLSIQTVTTMLQSSAKLGIYEEELFNLMIQGGLESLASRDSSEVKTYQAQALIRALDKIGVEGPLTR